MGRAIHRFDGEGLDLGLTLPQVLHLAVVDVVGPGTAFGDGEAAQRVRARGAVAGLEHRLARIGVGHGQGAGFGQGRVARILGHRPLVVARDDRGIDVSELIFSRLCLYDRCGFCRVGTVKAGAGDGGIAGSVDGDEAAIATGARDAADVARSGCPARCRRFKRLGRIRPLQDGLLQGRDIVRHPGLRVLSELHLALFGRLARAKGEGGIPSLEAGTFRSKQHGILGQLIAF